MGTMTINKCKGSRFPGRLILCSLVAWHWGLLLKGPVGKTDSTLWVTCPGKGPGGLAAQVGDVGRNEPGRWRDSQLRLRPRPAPSQASSWPPNKSLDRSFPLRTRTFFWISSRFLSVPRFACFGECVSGYFSSLSSFQTLRPAIPMNLLVENVLFR